MYIPPSSTGMLQLQMKEKEKEWGESYIDKILYNSQVKGWSCKLSERDAKTFI